MKNDDLFPYFRKHVNSKQQFILNVPINRRRDSPHRCS